ncbi:RNA-binding protein [Methylomonas sp. LWB]|uniref:RNA-binding S4 domain-containing protein n=1 Tax=Methylomonas sp. LWB TaxID=1905845 RepID=UPI0008DA7F77|nr:S4 domain-containing protein [Methylomonas sp. LWB]OHX35241.1 RNA-binding protein [Methylomonas sp. LWB]
MSEQDELRIDKWLWAARFFKTRGLASDAVSGGKVHVNGQRCKPSRDVRLGDRISITKDQYTWDILVTGLNRQRRPAQEAAQLYVEDAASAAKRQQLAELHKQQQAAFPVSERPFKPNKKQRRQIHRFKESSA